MLVDDDPVAALIGPGKVCGNLELDGDQFLLFSAFQPVVALVHVSGVELAMEVDGLLIGDLGAAEDVKGAADGGIQLPLP